VSDIVHKISYISETLFFAIVTPQTGTGFGVAAANIVEVGIAANAILGACADNAVVPDPDDLHAGL
jgi:hypothetical protein